MIATVPALLFSVVQAREASRMERRNAEQRTLQLARRIASRVDDHVGTIDVLLTSLSYTVHPDWTERARNDSLLGEISRELGGRFLQLSVADSAGRVGGNLAVGRIAWRTLLDQRPQILSRCATYPRPWRGRADGGADHRRECDRLRAANRRPGRLDVGSGGRIHTARPTWPLAGARRPAGWRGGSAVGQRRPRDRPDQRPAGFRRHGAAAACGEGGGVGASGGVHEVTGANGAAQLSGYARVSRVPWLVRVGVPSEVALAGVHARERQAQWLFAGSLAVSLLLAWLIARGITGPVRALTADVAAFASGHLTRRTAIGANGELGTLATTFHRMADALERRGTELSDSELRYRALFDTMPLPMWVYDTHSLRFLAVNHAAVERYGYTREEFLAMRVLDIRPEQDREMVRDLTAPGARDSCAVRRGGTAPRAAR
jgi:PAS domain S-box